MLLESVLMEELRRRVGKIWTACGSRSKKNNTSQLFWLVQTCPNLFSPVHPCSHLFTRVLTCTHLFKLFKPFHTCSHLFTTVHTPETTLFAQLHFLVEFSPWESCYFSILDLCLVKLHILAGLIESFPTEYGMFSCNEMKMSIPLGAHA